MKYLKSFIDRQKGRVSNWQRDRDINRICREYGIRNFKINKDGSIDVDGCVGLFNVKRVVKGELLNEKIYQIPIKFNKVTGDFNCSYNDLETLENSPVWVGGQFDAQHNNLISLEGGPKYVGNGFNVQNNDLKSLIGAPEHVGGAFSFGYNDVVSLEGFPKTNMIYVDCYRCPIEIIFDMITDDYSKVDLFNDYDVIQGTFDSPVIIFDRLNDFLRSAGIFKGDRHPGLQKNSKLITRLEEYYTIEY